MIKWAASFFLVVGFSWASLVAWMLVTIADIADWPESLTPVAIYWLGSVIGPVLLIIGSVLILRGKAFRFGTSLIVAGCLILSAFAIYNTVDGVHREPLQAPPPYLFYIGLILVMIVSDMTAYKLYQTAKYSPPAVPS
jgi:hypothetical protein